MTVLFNILLNTTVFSGAALWSMKKPSYAASLSINKQKGRSTVPRTETSPLEKVPQILTAVHCCCRLIASASSYLRKHPNCSETHTQKPK